MAHGERFAASDHIASGGQRPWTLVDNHVEQRGGQPEDGDTVLGQQILELNGRVQPVRRNYHAAATEQRSPNLER